MSLVLPQIASAQRVQTQTAKPEMPPQLLRETLTIGTTTLRLGLSKGIVLPSLGIEYGLMAIFPDRQYAVMAKSGAIGFVDFNAHGSLVAVRKVWTPESRPYTEGEIGRILVTLMASLVRDGNSACTIDVVEKHSVELKDPQPAVPQHVYRDAMIKCGQKNTRVSTTTDANGTDSLQINEELGNPEGIQITVPEKERAQ